MKYLHPFIRISFISSLLAFSTSGRAQVDSLADCFPLAVGNQWVYHLDRWLRPTEYSFLRDSGTIGYDIIGKADSSDSTLWKFRETRQVRRTYFDGTLQLDSMILASTLFDLVELNSGRHELFRRFNDPNPFDFNNAVLWNSVLPFLAGMPDSSKFYRFYRLDSLETIFFSITYAQASVRYNIDLKRNIGLLALGVVTTLTSEEAPAAYDQLLTQTVSSVDQDLAPKDPKTIRLHQNYPNPFNPATRIEYDVPVLSRVSLSIYSISGKEIARLVDSQSQIGHYTVWFDGTDLPSGVYFAELSTESSNEVKKMLFIR